MIFDRLIPLSGPTRDYLRGLARAFGGALLFAVPLFMTMEMWQLGSTMDRTRLALFIAGMLPIVFGLSRVSGFETTHSALDDALDTCVAFGIGLLASLFVLVLFAVVTLETPLVEIAGKVAIQGVPAAIGAMVANKQLQGAADDDVEDAGEEAVRRTYGGELFLMLGGALFVDFNLAPTEEMLVIAYAMTPWHLLALAAASLLLLHGFVYSLGFAGQEQRPEDTRFGWIFLTYTLTGYAICLLVAVVSLWLFQRTDGSSAGVIASLAVVLAFPGALGAATARLVV